MAELEHITTRVIQILDALQIKYVIVGGFAVIFRGRSRTTTDVDIIVENVPAKIPTLLQKLR